MSKLIMWNLITLDGYFEGTKSWDLEFHQSVWGDELERFSIEQLHTTDMLLFGRVTYEGMAAYWASEKGEIADMMNSLPKIVFSHTLKQADWNNTRLVDTDAVDEVRELKRHGQGNLFVFGSADLSASLINAGLFDEYRIGLVPAVLGKGRPLFSDVSTPMQLTLTESQPLSTGCVILKYEPQQAQ
ncbi:MAG: dihydrofolate reductase family protein [Gammaproteobacteria bacterium]|jgi:dihydrofolate reductase